MNFLVRANESQEEKNPFPSSTVKDPVYHGAKASFKEFEKRPSKRYLLFNEFHVVPQGFFFAEDEETARDYANGWIVKCFVDLKNPLLDPRKHKHLGVDRLPKNLEEDLVAIFSEAAEDKEGEKVIHTMLSDVYITEDPTWIYHLVGSGGVIWDVLDEPKVVQKMQSLGYDGTFVDEPNHKNNDRSIFVISEKQIKIVKWIRE